MQYRPSQLWLLLGIPDFQQPDDRMALNRRTWNGTYSPATVILEILIVGAAMRPLSSRSLPIISML
jgi:hypothetical protein